VFKCARCGAENTLGNQFCENCGDRLEAVTVSTNQSLVCPKCNAVIPSGSAFCQQCGNTITIELPPLPAPVSIPPSHIICPECNSTNTSDSVYCENCGITLVSQTGMRSSLAASIPVKKKTSAAWWLLPIFLGWVGGLLAWLTVRGKNKSKAMGLFLAGIGMTILWIVIGITISKL